MKGTKTGDPVESQLIVLKGSRFGPRSSVSTCQDVSPDPCFIYGPVVTDPRCLPSTRWGTYETWLRVSRPMEDPVTCLLKRRPSSPWGFSSPLYQPRTTQN